LLKYNNLIDDGFALNVNSIGLSTTENHLSNDAFSIILKFKKNEYGRW
jgi:hypothetical protein